MVVVSVCVYHTLNGSSDIVECSGISSEIRTDAEYLCPVVDTTHHTTDAQAP